jgi:hypothetical protein
LHNFCSQFIYRHTDKRISGDTLLRRVVPLLTLLIRSLNRARLVLSTRHTTHTQPPTEESAEDILHDAPLLVLLNLAAMEPVDKAQENDILGHTERLAGAHQSLQR